MRPLSDRFERRAIVVAFATMLGAAIGCRSKPSEPKEIIVGAATSMRHALPELVRTFDLDHPNSSVVVTYGGSGDIARQVEGGAGVDVVVFASKSPLEKLVKTGHVDAETIRIVGTNQLVLVGPEGSRALTFASLGTLQPDERLAIGDPKTVPVGQYAREALERLSLWDKLEGRLIFAANVAAVLAYVQRGEVAAAIVYRTEVQGVKGIVTLDEAQGPWAPRPEIWAGVVAESHERTTSRQFVDFMTSEAARKTLVSFGFGPP